MRFWDTSALVPLLVEEPASRAALDAYRNDPNVVAWWGTAIECVSAIMRRERDGLISEINAKAVMTRLSEIRNSWVEVEPSQKVRDSAIRLVRVHPLRAADALQLAAAIAASEGEPATLAFVTLDDRLSSAAEREGFPVTTFGLDS